MWYNTFATGRNPIDGADAPRAWTWEHAPPDAAVLWARATAAWQRADHHFGRAASALRSLDKLADWAGLFPQDAARRHQLQREIGLRVRAGTVLAVPQANASGLGALELTPAYRGPGALDAAALERAAALLTSRTLPGVERDLWMEALAQETVVHLHLLQGDAALAEARHSAAPLLIHAEAAGSVDSSWVLLQLLCLYELREYPAFLDTYQRYYGGRARFLMEILHKASGYRLRQEYLSLLRARIVVGRIAYGQTDPAQPYLSMVVEDWDPGRAIPGLAIPPPPAPVALVNEADANLLAEASDIALATAQDETARALFAYWKAYAARARRQAGVLDVASMDHPLLALAAPRLQAERYFQRGQYENALFLWQSAANQGALLAHGLDNDSRRRAHLWQADCHQWLGTTYLTLGDLDAATREYQQVDALRHDPDYSDMISGLNAGNLAWWRYYLNDVRGYGGEKENHAALKRGDPEAFWRVVMQRSQDALDQADTHYQRAAAGLELWVERQRGVTLDEFPHNPGRDQNPGAGARVLAAAAGHWENVIRLNRANVLWGHARLLEEALALSPALAGAWLDGRSVQALYSEARGLYAQVAHALEGMPTLALSTAGPMRASRRPPPAVALIDAAGGRELVLLALTNWCECEVRLGNWASARAQTTALLAQIAALEENTAPGQNYTELRWRLHWLQAQAAAATGDAVAAEAGYAAALAAAESISASLRSDHLQMTSLQNKWELVEDYLEFLYQHGTDASRTAMFTLTERLKARLFLELLLQARFTETGPLAAELQKKREPLLAQMNQKSGALRERFSRGEALGAEEVQADLDAYGELLREWNALLGELEGSLPVLEASVRAPITWEALRSLLEVEADTVVLAYFLGRRHSYLFLVEARALQVFQIPSVAARDDGYHPTGTPAPRGELEYAIAEMRFWARYDAPFYGPFVKASRRLAAMLLAGQPAAWAARARGKHLLVAPDGLLFYLPWEALLVLPTPTTAQRPLRARVDPDGLTALVEHYWLNVGPTTLVPSLSVWRAQRERVAALSRSPFMGVYNVDYSGSRIAHEPAALPLLGEIFPPFANLDKTDSVASVISAYTPADGRAPQPRALYTRPLEPPRPAEECAREENFERLCREIAPQYILFAGHGIYNDDFPQFSGLIFDIPTERGARGDGTLTLPDVWALDLPATDLVFLAACQGALGRLTRGEGVLALTRALMHRGAAAVIATLWLVPEPQTMELATRFFAALATEPTQEWAALLQRVKLAYLHNHKQSLTAPYFWAGPVLWGRGWPVAAQA